SVGRLAPANSDASQSNQGGSDGPEEGREEGGKETSAEEGTRGPVRVERPDRGNCRKATNSRGAGCSGRPGPLWVAGVQQCLGQAAAPGLGSAHGNQRG